MNIGEFARAAGVTPDSVRFYEKRGILPPAGRGINGYRRYDSADLARLRFLRSAQALGFTLAEIKAVLSQIATANFSRESVERHLALKIADIDQRIRGLRRMKRDLQESLASLACNYQTPLEISTVTRP